VLSEDRIGPGKNFSAIIPAQKRFGRLVQRYWALFKVSFQERMEYRWNTFMFMGMALLPALVAIYLWGNVYGANNNPEARTYITTYYLVACFIGWRIADYQWILMFDIREGRMANFLLRPMSYPAKSFWYEAGGRSWSTILTIPVFVLVAFTLGQDFRAPANPLYWLLAILAFLVAFVLNFFITMSLGLVTIWQNQPEGFFALYGVASRCLGGTLVPLALMPFGVGDIAQWLPFAYIYSLPIRIFLGLPIEQALQGFAVQLGWLAIAALFFGWLWRKAIWRYEVFEG
jgi:ABC-2 type transport system permease protein